MTKIAFATDDGLTISAHLGRAQKFMVVHIENGQVTAREERAKPTHDHHAGQQEDHHHHAHGHGDFHQRMSEVIQDCQIVVARGMGSPAYAGFQAIGIQPILTEFTKIEDAIQAYLRGDLVNFPQRVHH